MRLPSARWWELRPARNRKPAHYRCPLCGGGLPALSEHVLMIPEGDTARRRHAHTECVLAARREGRLPTRSEWQGTQLGAPGVRQRAQQRAPGVRQRAPEVGQRALELLARWLHRGWRQS